MINGVIFDMDGLMFDTERMWATFWEPALAALGLPYKEGLSEAARGTAGETLRNVVRQFYGQDCDAAAIVDSLHHLQKGGRLPKAVALVGGALGIKPVLALREDGEIKMVDKGRGRPGALVAMFKQIDKLGGVDPRYGYTLLYSDDRQLAAPVHHYMHETLHLTGGRVAQIGPTIGTHIGPSAVGVVFVTKE